MAAAFDYAPLAATAQRLLDRFGRAATLRRPSRVPVDPAKPWGANQTAAVASDDLTIPLRIVFVQPGRGKGPLQSGGPQSGVPRPSGSVRERIATAIIGPDADLTPLGPLDALADGWEVDDGAICYELVRVAEIKPGPTIVAYRASLRL